MIFLTVSLVLAGSALLFAKPILGSVASRALTRRIGTPVEVRIHELSPSEAGFSVRIGSPPLQFENLRLRWQVHSLLRGLVTANLSSRESQTALGPIALRGYSIEAVWERLSPLEWKTAVHLRATEIRHEERSFGRADFHFELDPRRLRLQVEGADPFRKKISVSYEAPGLPSTQNPEELVFAGRVEVKHPWATVQGPMTLALTRSGGFRSLQGTFEKTVGWEGWPKDAIRVFQSEVSLAQTGTDTAASVKAGFENRTLLRLTAERNADTGKASAKFALDWPLDWEGGKKAAPFLKEWLKKAAGTLAVSGKLEGVPGKYRTSGTLEFRDLAFRPGGIEIHGLKGRFDLTSLWPVVMPRQKLEIDSIGSSIPMKSFGAFLEIQRDEKLVVDTLAAEWAGGRVRVEKLEADLQAGEGRTGIELSRIDLESVLRANPAQKLQAKGTVSGQIPLRWQEGELSIDNAELHSDAPGWLRYGALSGAQAQAKILELGEFQKLMNQGQQALVFKALDNFFYDQLSLTVKRSSGKDLTALAELRGRNPDLARMPFQFNINISGQLEAALRETAMRLFVNPDAFWQNSKK